MTSELAGAWFEREGVFPPAHGDGMAGSGFLKGVALPGDERLAPVRGIGLLRRLFRFMAHFEGCRLKDVGSIHQERLEGFAFTIAFLTARHCWRSSCLRVVRLPCCSLVNSRSMRR